MVADSRRVGASRPRVAFIELTQRCNLRCHMCRPNAEPGGLTDMPPELLDTVLEDVVPGTEFVDLRGWGESLLVRELPRIVDELHRRGIAIRLITNLTVDRPKAIEALARVGAIIGISLDTAEPDKLHRLRTGARLGRIVTNIALLREAYLRYSQPFSRVYLNTAIGPENTDDIAGLVVLAGREGIKEVRLFPEMREDEIALQDPAVLPRLMAHLRDAGAQAESNQVRITIGARLHPEMAPVAPFRFRCHHPWTHTTVGVDGAVGFCDFLLFPGNGEHSVGNLEDESYDAVWSGEALGKVRRAHTSGDWSVTPAVSACEWCFRNRYIDFERELDSEYRSAVLEWRDFYPDLCTRGGQP